MRYLISSAHMNPHVQILKGINGSTSPILKMQMKHMVWNQSLLVETLCGLMIQCVYHFSASLLVLMLMIVRQ